MTLTLPTVGQTTWGGPLNTAVAAVAHSGFQPSDLGYQNWNYDPGNITLATAPVSGTIQHVRLPQFVQPATLTGLVFSINAAAVTPTAGQCFVALYDLATGTRVAVSADISGSLATTGLRQYAFTGTYAAALGANLIATILQNAATPATLGNQSATTPATIANGALTAATARWATGPAAQTSMPASITLSTRTAIANTIWAAAY